jgi:hypothetical protein
MNEVPGIASVQDVANAFKAALEAGDFAAAEAFWAEDVVSIENMDGPTREVRGRDAVHAKSVWWYGAHEIHSFGVEGPFFNGEQFALRFSIDCTRKEDSLHVKMNEIGLYTVVNGLIAEERFFY